MPEITQNTASYGTLSTLDTLASSQQNIAQYGEDRAWEAIDMALQAHNRYVDEMTNDFVETTTDRLRRFGNLQGMRMVKVDEFGGADAQKISAGQTVGFPLELYAIAVQWTKKYLQNMQASELAAQFTAVMDADVLAVITAIKKAIYLPTNYSSEDRLVDHLNAIQLPIKALVNADGQALPPGPNGETYNAATHTHYLAVATPNVILASEVTALIETVVEHYGSGLPVLYINRAQETAIRSLAGFTAYLDARIVRGGGYTSDVVSDGSSLDIIQLYNRPIGIFNGAEVIVKPWAIPNYIFCTVRNQPKPVVMRIRDEGSSGLLLAAENEDHPLRAKQFEREMGFGIWNRTNGAVLYTAGSSYTAPTFV